MDVRVLCILRRAGEPVWAMIVALKFTSSHVG